MGVHAQKAAARLTGFEARVAEFAGRDGGVGLKSRAHGSTGEARKTGCDHDPLALRTGQTADESTRPRATATVESSAEALAASFESQTRGGVAHTAGGRSAEPAGQVADEFRARAARSAQDARPAACWPSQVARPRVGRGSGGKCGEGQLKTKVAAAARLALERAKQVRAEPLARHCACALSLRMPGHSTPGQDKAPRARSRPPGMWSANSASAGQVSARRAG
mmetsp:Transcript_15531/g.49532  ORF Transcript_15531/g.49532 Transcript_15531/m.49532 type:complete len:223 (-) Transcript_15531:761-1429(-)